MRVASEHAARAVPSGSCERRSRRRSPHVAGDVPAAAAIRARHRASRRADAESPRRLPPPPRRCATPHNTATRPARGGGSAPRPAGPRRAAAKGRAAVPRRASRGVRARRLAPSGGAARVAETPGARRPRQRSPRRRRPSSRPPRTSVPSSRLEKPAPARQASLVELAGSLEAGSWSHASPALLERLAHDLVPRVSDAHYQVAEHALSVVNRLLASHPTAIPIGGGGRQGEPLVGLLVPVLARLGDAKKQLRESARVCVDTMRVAYAPGALAASPLRVVDTDQHKAPRRLTPHVVPRRRRAALYFGSNGAGRAPRPPAGREEDVARAPRLEAARARGGGGGARAAGAAPRRLHGRAGAAARAGRLRRRRVMARRRIRAICSARRRPSMRVARASVAPVTARGPEASPRRRRGDTGAHDPWSTRTGRSPRPPRRRRRHRRGEANSSIGSSKRQRCCPRFASTRPQRRRRARSSR